MTAGLNIVSLSPSHFSDLSPPCSPLPFCANRVLIPVALHTHGLVGPCMTKPKFTVEAPDSYLEAASQSSRHQTAHQGTYRRSYGLQVSPRDRHSNRDEATGWDTCREKGQREGEINIRRQLHTNLAPRG